MAKIALKEIIAREDRELRAIVHGEIEQGRKSKYWIGSAQTQVSSECDFDEAKLASDMQALFPHLHRAAILSAINSKIFLRYLR